MEISIQTGTLVQRIGLEKAFETIAEAGFDAVDLNLDSMLGLSWNEMREGAPSPFFSDRATYMGFAEQVKAVCAKTGLRVGQVHSTFPNWFRGCEEANRNFFEYTKVCIEMTHAVGCDRMVVHPLFEGSMRLTPTSREEEWEVNLDFYTRLIPELSRFGVLCCLENMWGQDWRSKKIYRTVCSDMDQAVRYIDELNARAGARLFGFCLDIGHLALVSEDVYDAIRTLGHDRLFALHTHDNRGYDDDHIMPYTGFVIWERFLRGLHEVGYDGTLNFETDGQYKFIPDDFLPTQVKMIAMVGRYFEKRLADMQKA